MKYRVLESDKFKFISLVLLNEIINFQHYFNVRASREEVFIERYLKFMYDKGVLSIDGGCYVPTALGREQLTNLYDKYYEYLKLYDIFSLVDLESGEFAFSLMDSVDSEEEWISLKNEERFSDVRVAVAEFKGIDAMEIVFMSFLSENRFDVNIDRWEYNLTGDVIWTEIEEILNSAISSDYLKENDALENVVREGTKIALEMIKNAQDYEDELDDEVFLEEEDVTYYVEIVDMPDYDYGYYEPYYDPYYVSPIWLVPVVLLW